MHQKRGLSYVDLAVSAGIFILYLIIAIVIFRPGIRSDFRPDILISIVEQNLRNEIYWEAQRYPIFISHPNYPPASDLEVNLIFDFPYNKGLVNNSNARVLNQNLQPLNFDINSDTGIKKNNISIEYELTQESRNYKDQIYLAVFSENNLATMPMPARVDTLSMPDTFTFQYGVSENLKGISNSRLNTFFISEYAAIKRKWGYPDARDFSFFIFDGAKQYETSNPIYVYERNKPLLDTKVYVAEYSDFILYENTTRKLVTVRIQAW